MKKLAAILIVSFTLSSCASVGGRTPSSDADGMPSETSIKLAKKLTGGSVKFVAQKKGGGDSFLRYLSVEFKNCVAEIGDQALRETGGIAGEVEDYVMCDSDFHIGPIKGRVNVKIWGEKKQFSFRFADKKNGRYDVEAEARMIWDSGSGKWTGSGFVNGWFKSGRADDGVTVTIRENILL